MGEVPCEVGVEGGERRGSCTSEKQLDISAARSLTPCLRLRSLLLLPPTPLGASPGVGSPRGGGGRWGGAAAQGTADWNPWGGKWSGAWAA